MKFLLGKKEGMTQIFDEEGNARPVTLVSVSSSVVTQVKNTEKDGYKAVQVGTGKQKEKKINKAILGHLKGKENFRFLREFRAKKGKNKEMNLNEGDKIDVNIFKEGEKISVSSTSKGKGFQGVVKRYDFAGGPRTHGQRHTERSPGSIGAMGHSRVQKGQKMPGRMGGKRITTKGLKIISIDRENGGIYVKGAVSGTKGTLVEIRS